jgi:hypothetical protein
MTADTIVYSDASRILNTHCVTCPGCRSGRQFEFCATGTRLLDGLLSAYLPGLDAELTEIESSDDMARLEREMGGAA